MRAALFVLFFASAAHATLDPARARESVEAARARGEDAFCTSPNQPVRGQALILCQHAREVPRCEALARACAGGGEQPEERTFPEWAISVARFVIYGLVALFLVATLALVASFLRSLRRAPRRFEARREAPAPEPARAVTQARALLARADALRGEDAERSLTLYLEASLRALDERGALRMEDDRTNGEYLRACSEEGARAKLRSVVGEVERVRFGRIAPTPAAMDRVARAAAAIVLAGLLSACGATPSRGPEGDPAGLTLLTRALEDQGVRVHGAGPLARLPLSSDGEALILDAQRIHLEPEARAHLRAWVEVGGSLVVLGAVPDEIVHGVEPTLAASGAIEVEGVAERGAASTPEGYRGVDRCTPIARVGEGTPYAVICAVGAGEVLAVATDDLFANVGFARGDNAVLALALLRALGPESVLVATPESGADPPDSPLASLSRAGLGLGMGHALAAAIALFIAVGARLGRARPDPPPTRRAFVEHVEATGALYARTRAASHALAALVRFVEERAQPDVPERLAQKSGLDPAACARVWSRARAPARGEELRALRELHGVLERAHLR